MWTTQEPRGHAKYLHVKLRTDEPPRWRNLETRYPLSPPLRIRQMGHPRAKMLDTVIKSVNVIIPHVRFRPNSSRLRGTSVQPRVIPYANTISHDSPAHHSYHPTRARRHRRQPVNNNNNQNNNNKNHNNNNLPAAAMPPTHRGMV